MGFSSDAAEKYAKFQGNINTGLICNTFCEILEK